MKIEQIQLDNRFSKLNINNTRVFVETYDLTDNGFYVGQIKSTGMMIEFTFDRIIQNLIPLDNGYIRFEEILNPDHYIDFKPINTFTPHGMVYMLSIRDEYSVKSKLYLEKEKEIRREIVEEFINKGFAN